MKLNLGSCSREFHGFTSVDRVAPADVVTDLEGPWPWPDSSVEEIRAYDVIEHIADCDHVAIGWRCERCARSRANTLVGFDGETPRYKLDMETPARAFDGRIHVMNEAWRVLQPGGLFDIEVPTTDGMGAWQDPTHRTYWNRNSFLYYTAGDPHRERFDGYYGVLARFRVESEKTLHLGPVVKLQIKLRAVK